MYACPPSPPQPHFVATLTQVVQCMPLPPPPPPPPAPKCSYGLQVTLVHMMHQATHPHCHHPKSMFMWHAQLESHCLLLLRVYPYVYPDAQNKSDLMERATMNYEVRPTKQKMPNSLSLTLTKSVLFLCTVHVHHTPSSHDNNNPAILCGLLVLSLTKPTCISSISIELVAESVTIWTEGMSIFSAFLLDLLTISAGQSSHYPTELQEKNNIYSATHSFFQAPQTATGQHSLSLNPSLSHYMDQEKFNSHCHHSTFSLSQCSCASANPGKCGKTVVNCSKL